MSRTPAMPSSSTRQASTNASARRARPRVTRRRERAGSGRRRRRAARPMLGRRRARPRPQHPVDHEPGALDAAHRRPADRCAKFGGGLRGLGRRVVALDDLDDAAGRRSASPTTLSGRSVISPISVIESSGRGGREDRVAGRGTRRAPRTPVLDLHALRHGLDHEVDVAEAVEGDARRRARPDAGGLDRGRDLAAASPVPTTAALKTNMAPTLAVALGGELVGEARERALQPSPQLAPQPPPARPGRASSLGSTSSSTVIRVRTLSVSKRTRCSPRTRSSSNASVCPSPAA